MIQSTLQFCRRSAGETAAGAALYLWGAGFAAVAVWQGTGYLCLCPLPAPGGRLQAGAGARRALCPGLRRGAASPELLPERRRPCSHGGGAAAPRILLPGGN